MIDILKLFISFKIISSNSDYKSEIWKGAKFLKKLIENLGVETQLIQCKIINFFFNYY